MRVSYIALFAAAVALAGLPSYAGPGTGKSTTPGQKPVATKTKDTKTTTTKNGDGAKTTTAPKKENESKKTVTTKKNTAPKQEDEQVDVADEGSANNEADKKIESKAPTFASLKYDELKDYKPEISFSGKKVNLSLRMPSACSSSLTLSDAALIRVGKSVTVTKDTTKEELEDARAEYGLKVDFVSDDYASLKDCVTAHHKDGSVVKTISSNAEINPKEAARVGFLNEKEDGILDEKSVKNKSSLDDLASKLADLKDMTCSSGNCYTSDATRSDAISKMSSTIASINNLIKSIGLDGNVDFDAAELQKMLDAVLASADSATDIGAIAKASKSLKEFSLKLVAIHNSKAAKDFDVDAAAKSLNDKQNDLYAKAKGLNASSEESANDIVALMSEIRDNQSKNPGLSSDSKTKLWKEARVLRQRGSDERLAVFKEKMPSHTEIREDRKLRINNYNGIVRPVLVNDYIVSLANYQSRGCPVMMDQGSTTQPQPQVQGQPQRKTAHMLPNVAAIQSSGNMYCAQLAAPLTNAYWALKNGDKAVDAAMALALADLTGAPVAGNGGVSTNPSAGTSNITSVKVPQYEPVQNAALTAAIAAYNNGGSSNVNQTTVQTTNAGQNTTTTQPVKSYDQNGLYNPYQAQGQSVPTANAVSFFS